MHREGINYPKFKDQFAAMDFEAEPMPVLSLFPMPDATPLDDWELLLTGASGQRRSVSGDELRALPSHRLKSPIVCQIFNWVERPEVEGVRLSDVLALTGIDVQDSGFFSFYSKDGLYFEGLPRSIARDPRVMLVFALNGEPLPREYGGPLRLWVPFLQGYKSVKWVHQIRAFHKDPIGIKRLLNQSKTAILGPEGQDLAGIVVARAHEGGAAIDV